jgi:hypothetical protein
MYKYDLEFEKYLNCVNINKYRVQLTQFRLSSHCLEIKIGRHNGVPRENRLCQQCNMHVIENEFHFLLVCPKYHNLRKKNLKPYFCRLPTLKKMETLMSS